MIDSEARASESVASSAVSRALTAAVGDVVAEWPHTEHGATSVGDVRTTVTAQFSRSERRRDADLSGPSSP